MALEEFLTNTDPGQTLNKKSKMFDADQKDDPFIYSPTSKFHRLFCHWSRLTSSTADYRTFEEMTSPTEVDKTEQAKLAQILDDDGECEEDSDVVQPSGSQVQEVVSKVPRTYARNMGVDHTYYIMVQNFAYQAPNPYDPIGQGSDGESVDNQNFASPFENPSYRIGQGVGGRSADKYPFHVGAEHSQNHARLPPLATESVPLQPVPALQKAAVPDVTNEGSDLRKGAKVPTWHRMKYLPSFLKPWQDIPGKPSCAEICRLYPNHLHGKWLDAFIQHRWSDADMEKELLTSTHQQWIELGICTKPKNKLMKSLIARWVALGPEGLTKLDNAAKIHPAHKTGKSKQLLVRDPERWIKFHNSRKTNKSAKVEAGLDEASDTEDS